MTFFQSRRQLGLAPTPSVGKASARWSRFGACGLICLLGTACGSSTSAEDNLGGAEGLNATGGTGAAPAEGGGGNRSGGKPGAGGATGGSGAAGSPAPRGDPGPGVLAKTSCEDDPCDPNAECTQVGDSARCDCTAGFRGDGVDCSDVHECDEKLDRCAEAASCKNTEGGYECSCPSGAGDGLFCSDASVCDGKCRPGSCTVTATGYACDCPLGTGGVDCEIDCSGELSFSPSLEEYVRWELNKPDGPIFASDFEHETWFSSYEVDISDLSGLECWTHLEHFNLGRDEESGPTPSLAPLAGLSRLTHVDVTCSEITDLSALTNKPHLETLLLENFSHCRSTVPLEELTPVSSLTSLKTLWLGGRPLGDLSSLASLGRLTDLIIVFSDVDDVGFVSELTSLERLLMYGNEITTLPDLSKLANLRELAAGSNPLDDLTPLENHPALRELALRDANLTDLSSVGTLPQLLVARLDFNAISDVSPLSHLTRFSQLDVSNNELSDLSSLLEDGFFGYSGSLDVRDNPLDCSTQPAVIRQLADRGVEVGVRDGYCD